MLAGDGRLVVGVLEPTQGVDLNADGDTDDIVPHVLDLASGDSVSLGLAAVPFPGQLYDERWYLFVVSEEELGEDLNGDGDAWDSITHVHDLESGETVSSGVNAGGLRFGDGWVVFQAGEDSGGGNDLNGDGDTEDVVLFMHDFEAGRTTSLGHAGHPWLVLGDRIVYGVSEPMQGADLNGDGDLVDTSIIHVHDRSSGKTVNLGLQGQVWGSVAELPVIEVRESWQGEDLDGDGEVTERSILHFYDFVSGSTTNTGISGRLLYVTPARVISEVDESWTGADLNGDGDAVDTVAFVHDLASGTSSSLGVAGRGILVAGNRYLLFEASEAMQGDLNGDGDAEDTVAFVHDLASGSTRNLGLAVRPTERGLTGWPYALEFRGPLLVRDDWLILFGWEMDQAEDLNGDGDERDEVLFVHDLRSGKTFNTGVAAGYHGYHYPAGDHHLVVNVRESLQGEDLNGSGGRTSNVSHLLDLTRVEQLPVLRAPLSFRRGDCNADRSVDLADAVCIVDWLFLGSAESRCVAALNANGEGGGLGVDLSDAISLLNHLFLGGPPPNDPYPGCGPGTQADLAVNCEPSLVSCP